jgi:hypothetical protein
VLVVAFLLPMMLLPVVGSCGKAAKPTE